MFRLLIVGWAKIASGNVAAGLLRFVGIAIAARALSLDVFGILVQIEAYVRVIDGLLNFQSVNVLTRYLVEADRDGDKNRFAGFVKAGILVDAGTALFSCSLAVALLPFLYDWLSVPSEWLIWAILFCLVIITRLLGTTEAILRCFDRYGSIASRELIISIILVAGSLLAWAADAGGEVFLMVWMMAEVIANIVFIGLSLRVLRQHGIDHVVSANARKAMRSAPSFWSQLWHTNITYGVRIVSQQGDLIIAGMVLGPAAAALLRAAKVTTALLSQVGRPLQQVASAQITRLWAGGDGHGLIAYTVKICGWSAAAGVVAAAAFWVIGDLPLSIAFGEAYADARVIVAILALAMAVYLGGITLLPTMVTLGLSDRFFLAGVIGTVGFVIVLGFGIQSFGNLAIAWAHVAFNVLWLLYGWHHIVKHVRAHTGVNKAGMDITT